MNAASMLLALAVSTAPNSASPAQQSKPMGMPPVVRPSAWSSHENNRSFATCLATVDWPLVKPVFDVGVGTDQEQRILRRAAAQGQCKKTAEGEYWNTELRHSIAEIRYRLLYSNAQLPSATSTNVPSPEGARFVWTSSTGNRPWQAFQALAACLAEKDAGLVHSVLMTDENSPSERETMAALAQSVGPCLRPGKTIKISTLELRSWLAEAQYQMMRVREPKSDPPQ